MKSYKKQLLTSVAAIGVSAALISGATFALFSGESKTNIAVTSGKVKVIASITGLEAYSAKWDDATNTYVNDTLKADDESGFKYTFANNGEVVYDAESNYLTIDRITPGDGVKLQISVVNESTVDIRYQTRVIISYPEDTKVKLGEALDITVDGKETKSAGIAYVTGWSEPIAKSQTIDDISVEISMPWEIEAYEGLNCDIAVTVYAIQGNASADTPIADALVNSAESLKDALENANDGDVIGLVDDIVLDDEDAIEVPENTDVVVDLGGKDLTINKQTNSKGSKNNIKVGAGSSFTFTNSSEDGSFNLDIAAGAGNTAGADGEFPIYAKGEGENRAELNFENVKVNVSDDNYYDIVVMADDADVNLSAGTVFNIENDDYYAAGIYGSNGAHITVDGAQINGEGNVTPFVVGTYGKEDSYLDFVDGEINLNNASGRMFAVQLNAGGHFNMTGGTINITGDLTSYTGVENSVAVGADNRSANGDTIAEQWACADTSIEITGGTINLAPSKGTAYGIVLWPGNPTAVIGGNAVINCNAENQAFAYAITCSVTYDIRSYGGELLTPSLTLKDDVQINILGSATYNSVFKIGQHSDWSASKENVHDETGRF